MGGATAIALLVSVISLVVAEQVAAASGGGVTKVDVGKHGFGLHFTIDLTKRWRVLPSDPAGPPASKAVGLVHVGVPDSDESQWWGPDILIVDGARVHRSPDAVSRRPAKPDPAAFVPWPSSLFGYLASLPGVEVVARPMSVTIGGVRGTQFTVKTPPMHPIFWLAGDTAWIGGGPTGVDPVLTRRYILLKVKGKQLLLAYADTPSAFTSRWSTMRDLFDSINF